MLRKYISVIQAYKFSNLPKSSRFSQQLGLQKQFRQLQVEVQKQQTQTVAGYQFIIGGSMCIFGTLLITSILLPSFRASILLFFKAFDVQGKEKQRLKDVVEYQGGLKNRIFSDRVGIWIIERCLKKRELYSAQYVESVEQALKTNLKNTKNKVTNNKIYTAHLQNLIITNNRSLSSSKHSPQIIQYLLQSTNIQTLYLISYLHRLNKIELNQQNKNDLQKHIMECKNKIQIDKKKIKQLRDSGKSVEYQIGLEACLYQIGVREKWIQFMLKGVK